MIRAPYPRPNPLLMYAPASANVVRPRYQTATSVADLATGGAYVAPAYVLTAAGLQPLE